VIICSGKMPQDRYSIARYYYAYCILLGLRWPADDHSRDSLCYLTFLGGCTGIHLDGLWPVEPCIHQLPQKEKCGVCPGFRDGALSVEWVVRRMTGPKRVCEIHPRRPLRRCAGSLGRGPSTPPWGYHRVSSGMTGEMVLAEPRSGQPPAKEVSIGRGHTFVLSEVYRRSSAS